MTAQHCEEDAVFCRKQQQQPNAYVSRVNVPISNTEEDDRQENDDKTWKVKAIEYKLDINHPAGPSQDSLPTVDIQAGNYVKR